MNEKKQPVPRGLTPWKPGQSGNPAGRPVGARNRFAEQFCKDLADKWEACGADVIDKVVADDPAKFLSICAGLIPRELALTLEARTPGGLDADDWALALEVFRAIKDTLPNATDRQPGEVLEFVSKAIRTANAKLIEVEPEDTAPLDVDQNAS